MQFENNISTKDYFNIMLDMIALSVTLVTSLSLWVISMIANTYYGSMKTVSPWRWLFSILVPLSLSSRARKRENLESPAILGGLIIGFILMMANISFFSSVLAFFVSYSKIRSWKQNFKGTLDSPKDGHMSTLQIFYNCGIPTELAVLYMIEIGPRDTAVDFERQYGASWLSLSLLGALACRAGDSWAAEVGPLLSKTPPRLITTWKEVPAGTNGGVTPEGLVASCAGGMTVGTAYFISQILFVKDLHLAVPQWPIVVYGGVAGLLGSLLDSYLGAKMQYTGYDQNTGKVVSYESKMTRRISGKPILDNNAVNLFSSLIIALTMPGIAWSYWPRF